MQNVPFSYLVINLQFNFRTRFTDHLDHKTQKCIFHDFSVFKTDSEIWCILLGIAFLLFFCLCKSEK